MMIEPISILHLEDTEADSLLVKYRLKKDFPSFEYFFVDNEIDYIRVLKEHRIDIILSDYHVPGYGGEEALKVAHEHYPSIPFIFVTGKMGEDTAIESLTNGAIDYVLKSKLERLGPAIKRALNEANLVKEKEAAIHDLKKSEENFRTLFENIIDVFYKTNMDGQILMISPSIQSLLGFHPEELLGENVDKLYQDIEERNLFLNILKLEGRVNDHQITLKDRQGQSKYVAISAKLIRDQETNLNYIIGSLRDITERKLVGMKLQEAEWKFKVLFEKAPLAVAFHEMIYNENGEPIDYRYIDANKTFVEVMGVDPIGRKVTEVFPGIENDPFDWIHTYDRVAQHGEYLRFKQTVQLNNTTYDCAAYQYKPGFFVVAFIEVS